LWLFTLLMKHFVYIIIFLAVISSCKKEPTFAPVPVIAFEKFVAYNADSADCYITFKDGNGQIGNLIGDTTFNLVLEYLHKVNGTFVPYITNIGGQPIQSSVNRFGKPTDTLFYPYQIPNLTPTGQYQAIQGEIKVKLRTAPVFSPTDSVVKFSITLWDRNGNQSNTVTTDEIIVPQ